MKIRDIKLMQNEEHREAIQQRATDATRAYLISLGGNHIANYDYIDSVMAELKTRDVNCVLHAMFPRDDTFENSPAYMQFNNLVDPSDFVNGKASPEAQIKWSYANHAFIHAFLQWAGALIFPTAKSMSEVLAGLYELYFHADAWLRFGKRPPHLGK